MHNLPRSPGYILTAEEVITDIDCELFKRQRSLLYNLSFILDSKLTPRQNKDMEGVIALLEAIADVAHDRYEMDTVFVDGEKSLYDPNDFAAITGWQSDPNHQVKE